MNSSLFGFADPWKYQTLISGMERVRKEYEDNRRDSCDEMEVIDLSDSEVDNEF